MRPHIPCALVIALTIIPLFDFDARSDGIPSERAWAILQVNFNENSTEKRVQATRVLALLPGDSRASNLAKEAATDGKPEVRAAAATALGQFHEQVAVNLLHRLLDDPEPSVALAAANALTLSKDPAAYDVYYEFLTGERKATNGMIANEKKTLHDPKKMAKVGFEEGIGVVPFGGMGYGAFKALRTDDVSPVRAAAAKILANDPDPQSGRALVNATSDKSWIVRTAALEAIAKRGDPKLLDSIVPALLDANTSVRCTAAAAVIRLSTLAAQAKTN